MPGTENKDQVSYFYGAATTHTLVPPFGQLPPDLLQSCRLLHPTVFSADPPPPGSHRHLTLLSVNLGSEFSLRKSLQHSWMSPSQRMAALFS